MTENARRRLGWVWKGALVLFALLATGAAVLLGIAHSDSTDCFAEFKSTRDAERVVAIARDRGLVSDLGSHGPHGAFIRVHSGETGSDAKDFRVSVRQLVVDHDGKMEQECHERPFFN